MHGKVSQGPGLVRAEGYHKSQEGLAAAPHITAVITISHALCMALVPATHACKRSAIIQSSNAHLKQAAVEEGAV